MAMDLPEIELEHERGRDDMYRGCKTLRRVRIFTWGSSRAFERRQLGLSEAVPRKDTKFFVERWEWAVVCCYHHAPEWVRWEGLLRRLHESEDLQRQVDSVAAICESPEGVYAYLRPMLALDNQPRWTVADGQG